MVPNIFGIPSVAIVDVMVHAMVDAIVEELCKRELFGFKVKPQHLP